MGSELYSSHPSKISAPEPNPEFTFPMLPPLDANSKKTVQSAASRRAANRSRQLHISTSPLPQFSFPSGSDRTPPTGESIEVSPTRSIPTSARNINHKRGGSEFIGGDGLLGGPGLLSSSPTKSQSSLPTPPTSGRRRGHAHRRSGAISNHDLSAILNPNSENASRRTGSAPTTPCDPNSHRQFIPSLDRSASQPTLHQSQATDPSTESPRETSPATVQSRPRVGFSDTLEFIPRPLSIVSTTTTSSVSTVRPSHSLSGSISSIRSGTSSPPSAKKNRLSMELTRDQFGEVRPKTADSTFNSPSPNSLRRQASPPFRPSSASGSKIWKAQLTSFLTEDQEVTSPSAIENTERPHTPKETTREQDAYRVTPQFYADLQKLRGVKDSRPTPQLSRPRSSPEVKIAKRQRKVKSWAGSLLSRKGKNQSDDGETMESSESKETLKDFAPLEDFPLDDVNFDDDTTCVIRSPGYQPRPATAGLVSTFSMNTEMDMDPAGVLDLDAWQPLENSSPASPSGFPNAKRRMHSGGGTGGFIGPGMHYHRRAESAPNLLPIDHSFGFPRLGSCPQMADVFEEEEEDDSKPRDKSAGKSRKEDEKALTGLGVKIVDEGNDFGDVISPRTPRPKRSKESTTQSLPTMKSSSISDSVADQVMMAEIPIEIVDSIEEPRFSIVTKSSDGSTITPTMTGSQLSTNVLPVPMDFAGTSPAQLSENTELSSNPSPDFGNASFDVPRLGTAHSSITDRSVWSSARTGESVPDTTTSVEDVPSLTSSASTAISGHPVPFSPTSLERPSGERSFSFSGAVPRRTRPVSAGKRASLASLSRLVGGSYGEKSKLSIESRAQQDEADKSEKKKRNRISRMMKFWKSKEKLTSES